MPRRLALVAIAIASTAVGLIACSPDDPRPNVILVITDDHRHDAFRSADHSVLRTPELDALAEAGLRFTSACVTTSLCSPSRASFFTGCYAHTHGVVANEKMDLPGSLPTVATALQASGYETAFVGKWHQARWSNPRPGFDHWVAFNRQGDYLRNTLNVDGDFVLSTEYITDELTRFAERFIRDRSRPFFLVLAHKAVHEPFVPARRHERLYPDAEAPPARDEDLTRKPDWGGRLNPSDPDGRVRRYLQTLTAVDESVGRLRAALRETGQLDNTLFVYAGDNGYQFGEHGGIWDKRTAYEESIRIPLILSWPARWPQGLVRDALALNIDVAPTILAACEVPIPGTMQGRSLLPQIDGAAGRDAFLYEYFAELGPTPTILAVRTRRWKYIEYPDDPDLTAELYDLVADPHELRNLVAEPDLAADRERLRGLLRRLQDETDFRWPPTRSAPEAARRSR